MEYVKVFYDYTQSVTRTTTPTSVIADRWSVESVQVERGRAERDNSCCPSVTWNVGIPLGRQVESWDESLFGLHTHLQLLAVYEAV